MGWISGNVQCSLGSIAFGFYQRLEAESLQTLCHRAAIPAKRFGRGLHVEAMSSQTVQDRRIAGEVGSRLFGTSSRLPMLFVKPK